jgi:hypothetical protein
MVGPRREFLRPTFISSWSGLIDHVSRVPSHGSLELVKCRSGMAMSESSDKERTPLPEKDDRDHQISHPSGADQQIISSDQDAAAGVGRISPCLEEAEEDGVYSFYHGSNKLFFLQDPVKAAFRLIEEIGGESDPPNFEYARIVEAGTAHQFGPTTNENWEAELSRFWRPSGTPNTSSI